MEQSSQSLCAASEHEDWIDQIIAAARIKGLDRHLRAFPNVGGKIEVDGRTLLNFASNDYLGLATHPRVVEQAHTALKQYGAGAAASRLVSGTLNVHEELEARLAAFKNYPAALVFGSGFLANLGVITVLAGTRIFADRLVHASIVDGISLARSKLHRFRHNDAGHLDELLTRHPGERALVLVESVYSMDGDLAPLEEIGRVANRHGAMLVVDEAHATGIFGDHGRGLIDATGTEPYVNVAMGTMSKALGGYGGFIACSERVRSLCVNRARSLIYTTALPPSVAGAALGALDVLESEGALGATLLARASRFRRRLNEAGFNTLQSESQIVPVVVGGNEDALAFASALSERGVLVAAIRPPTVPSGMARLRFSITLGHSDEDCERAAEAVITCGRRFLS